MADLAIKMNWKFHNGEPNKMKVSRCVNGLKKAKYVSVIFGPGDIASP